MTNNDRLLLIECLRNAVTIPVKCVEKWNGFEAGNHYGAELNGNGDLVARDEHGISTPISQSSCHFFELASNLPAQPTPEERLAAKQEENAATLRQLGAYLTAERPTFNQAQLVKWIPGMCNRRIPSESALMYVIEQTDPQEVRQDGVRANPNDIELVDLRVAALACSARDDEQHIVEVMVDSRRVQLWGQ